MNLSIQYFKHDLVRLCSFVVAGAAALALVACGGGDDTPVATAATETITAVLTGDQEAPARVNTGATGTATFTLDRTTRTLSGTVSVDGVVPTVAHIHSAAAGTAGPVSLALTVSGNSVSLAPTVLSAAQLTSLDAGELYVNIHSAANPTGEIRGQIGREVYTARLSGAQETTPVASAASGTGFLVLNPVTRALGGEIEVQGMTVTVAHVHSGAFGVNGPVVIGLEDHGGHGHYSVPANTVLTQAQVDSLRAGGLYFNAHSAAHATGEIRGQIGRRVLQASANGTQEVPANGSAATGRAFVVYDFATRSIEGRYTLSGMTATVAHIHAGVVGVNGPVVQGLTETTPGSGVWAVPANAKLSATQAQTLLGGGMYVNAHSAAFAAGEIRGQLTAR
jgi:CHRD domain